LLFKQTNKRKTKKNLKNQKWHCARTKTTVTSRVDIACSAEQPHHMTTPAPRSVLQVFETYQKARIAFVQSVADLATNPKNIEVSFSLSAISETFTSLLPLSKAFNMHPLNFLYNFTFMLLLHLCNILSILLYSILLGDCLKA
jgi:hypothetical protein